MPLVRPHLFFSLRPVRTDSLLLGFRLRVTCVRVLPVVFVEVIKARAVVRDRRVDLLARLAAEPLDARIGRLRACHNALQA